MTVNDDTGDGIATALRYITGLALDAEEVRGAMLDGYHAVALPKDYNIHRLEGLAPFRDRARGAYTTTSVDDFARVANEHKVSVRTFVDAQHWTASAVLNFGSTDQQGHCDYIARLVVTPSPEWVALLSLHGAKFSQRALVDFIEDWAHCIPVFFDIAGQGMTKEQAIAAFNDVRITSAKTSFNTVAPLKTERGVMESIEARDADKWPGNMGWACTPALGLQPINATVRLSALTAHDTPTIGARVVGIEALREQVATHFSMLLQSKLDTPPLAGHFDAGA